MKTATKAKISTRQRQSRSYNNKDEDDNKDKYSHENIKHMELQLTACVEYKFSLSKPNLPFPTILANMDSIYSYLVIAEKNHRLGQTMNLFQKGRNPHPHIYVKTGSTITL